MPVIVVAPKAHVRDLPPLGPEVRVLPYANLAEATAALRDHSDPAVLWSDGLFQDDPTDLAATVRGRSAATIEVRSHRWDGLTPSRLSEACRGVISGFGPGGVTRAVELLLASPS